MATLTDLITNGLPQLKQAADDYHDASNKFNQLKADFYPVHDFFFDCVLDPYLLANGCPDCRT